jgi:uncharacterized protein YecE (DUF72 family)
MVKVGLCGFTIGMDEYFETYPVVEIQHTFYEPPPLATMVRWRERAGPAFEFTIKAWQVITHRATSTTYRRMKTPLTARQQEECGAFRVNPTTLGAWERTDKAARAVRATAILFQCPASFRSLPENIDNMRSFFGAIEKPAGVRFLWEPRGKWDRALVREICAELGLVHAVDPFVNETVTRGVVYWRLHGLGSAYRSYTDEELRRLAAMVRADEETYAMFNNIPRPADSRRFLAVFRGATPARAASARGRRSR